MSVEIVASGSAILASGGSATVTHAINAGSGINRMILVYYLRAYGGWGGVTYAGESLTELIEVQMLSGFWRLYRRMSPTTGNNNIVINTGSYARAHYNTTTFQGVDQANPWTTSDNHRIYSNAAAPATTNVTLTPLNNGLVFGWLFASVDNINFTSNSPSILASLSPFGDSHVSFGAAYRTSAGLLTAGYTGSMQWHIYAIAINGILLYSHVPDPRTSNFASLLAQ